MQQNSLEYHSQNENERQHYHIDILIGLTNLPESTSQ